MSDDTDRRSSELALLTSSERVGQYISTGTFGTVVDMLVLFVLVDAFLLSVGLAKIVAWEASVVVIFLVNERWTFESWGETGRGPFLRRFVSSNVIRAAGLAVTFSVLVILHYWFQVWYMFANLAGIAAGFGVNYLFECLYTWNVEY